jgi:hypothetical protein
MYRCAKASQGTSADPASALRSSQECWKDDVYRLDDQAYAERFAGMKVRITGTLDEKKQTLHVLTIEPVR